MDALDVTGLLVLGFAAGMAGGLLGVGGGILFVPRWSCSRISHSWRR